MISEAEIKTMIPFALEKTNFSALGEKYEGKVRDNYSKDGKRIIISTDRISAFDVVLGTIPFRGQLLNEMANFWFKKTESIIPNHVIDIPDPNVSVVKEAQPMTVEMIVRAYITGSAWRAYEKGETKICGIQFPAGLKKNQKLDEPVLTPTTKAEKGTHDENISREEIVSRGLVEEKLYKKMEKTALALFSLGTKTCSENNLILVDTKYEFGLTGKKLVLIDEIHTPDSSRFWYADGYQQLFDSGQDQKQLSKEFLREWLIAKCNYMGNGPIPNIPDDVKVEFCKRYIESFETVTGKAFNPAIEQSILARIEKNLKKKKYL
jgi:phosphoribosylaminoimidazole-succinocarboxamide synthase